MWPDTVGVKTDFYRATDCTHLHVFNETDRESLKVRVPPDIFARRKIWGGGAFKKTVAFVSLNVDQSDN